MATFPRRRRIYEACSCMLASYILTYIYIQRKNLCTYIFKRDSVAHVTNTCWIRYRGRFKVSENAFHFSIFVFLFFFFFFSPQRKHLKKHRMKMTVPLESAMTRVCTPKKLVFKSNCCFPF